MEDADIVVKRDVLRCGLCQTGALVYKGFNLLGNPDNPLVLIAVGFLRTIPTGRSSFS